MMIHFPAWPNSQERVSSLLRNSVTMSGFTSLSCGRCVSGKVAGPGGQIYH